MNSEDKIKCFCAMVLADRLPLNCDRPRGKQIGDRARVAATCSDAATVAEVVESRSSPRGIAPQPSRNEQMFAAKT